MQNTLYSFKNDLGQLYCLTKNSNIEAIFIKVSQAVDEDFNRWFSRNRPNIKSQLQNPDVADLLDALIETRKTYYSVSIVDFVDMIQGGNKKISGGIGRNVGNIRALSGLMSDADLQPILSPYRDIITAAQNFTEATTIPIDVIASDLKIIKSAYHIYLREISTDKSEKPSLKKPNLKKRQKQFFAYILQRFTQEVSQAAEASGFRDLAEAIRNNALLIKPSIIGEYTYVSNANMFTKQRADNVAQMALKNISEERFEIMYQYIKEQTMEFIGLVSVTDLAKLYQERERSEDVSEYTGTEGKKSELIKIDVTNQMWLNPSFLGMLSYILNHIYRMVKD